jgi:hypothetical protein
VKLVAGPGTLSDHLNRPITVPPDHAAYQDDDGRIVVQAATPHPLLRTRWEPVDGADVPAVEIVGVQEFSTGVVEVVARPLDFSAEFTDAYGEQVAVRSLALDQLVEFWQPSEVAQAQQTVADILTKLGRLG